MLCFSIFAILLRLVLFISGFVLGFYYVWGFSTLVSCMHFFFVSQLNKSRWTQTFTKDLPVSVSNSRGLQAFTTLSTAEAGFMPRLQGKSRKVLGDQRRQSQLCFVKPRDQHMEVFLPFRLRDTSPPRTPSSGISDKRPRLGLSGQTLRH